MRKQFPGRTVARWLAAFFAAIFLLAAILLFTFDWNRARPLINREVSDAIGRPFAINGDLRMTWTRSKTQSGWRGWVPWPRLSAQKIAVGNPDWTHEEHFATLDEMAFEVELLPLLAHRIAIPRIEVVNPSVHLQRLNDGRANWTFNLPSSGQSSPWTLDLGDVLLSKGRITYRDAQKHADLDIVIDTLDQSAFSPLPAAPKYALAWIAAGVYRGGKIHGSGKTGGVLAIKDAKRPFPVQAELSIGDTRLAVAGTLTDPANIAALDLRLQLSGVSMAHLYGVTGILLPETPPYATQGHLTGRMNGKASLFTYKDFAGHVGASDLNGTLTYQAGGARPMLTGKLVSNLLQFADLAPIIGADSSASKARRGDTAVQPQGRLLPVEEFHTDRWSTIDADVEFTGRKIVKSADLPVTGLYARAMMTNGVLTLSPLRLTVASGSLTSDIQLDGRSRPMKARVSVTARHLKLKQLLPSLAVQQTWMGEIDGDAALSAVGNSPAALASTSNGEIKAFVSDGEVSRWLMEAAGLNVANVVYEKLFKNRDVKINCAVADLVATRGLLTPRVLALDTDDSVIDVNGNIDLRSETLNLGISPKTKGFRVISLRSPLYVRGTFKAPKAGVQLGPLLARGGATLGLGLLNPLAAIIPLLQPSSSEPMACQKLLADARARPRGPR